MPEMMRCHRCSPAGTHAPGARASGVKVSGAKVSGAKALRAKAPTAIAPAAKAPAAKALRKAGKRSHPVAANARIGADAKRQVTPS